MFIAYPRQRKSLNARVEFSRGTDPEGRVSFSDELCDRVIALAEHFPAESGLIDGRAMDKSFRNATTHFIQNNAHTQWLFQRLLNAAMEANNRYWHFDVTGFFQPLQLVHYSAAEEQHYSWHLDIGSGLDTGRKISISLQLSAEDAYEGGDLELNTGVIIGAERARGSIVMFPSYILHRVTPVTRGERWALVGWVQGQDHFR